MLRLTEIKLPLDHAPEAIAAAAAARLKIPASDLISCVVFRRAHDARKKSNIFLIYSLDVEVKDEAAVLKRFAKDVHVKPTPNIDYQYVARAPENFPLYSSSSGSTRGSIDNDGLDPAVKPQDDRGRAEGNIKEFYDLYTKLDFIHNNTVNTASSSFCPLAPLERGAFKKGT